MNKTILIMLAFLACNENAEFAKYKEAFDYIKKSPLIRTEFGSVINLLDTTNAIPLNVSDTIVPLSISDFFGLGDDVQVVSADGKPALDSLLRMDKKMDFSPFVYERVGQLSTDSRSRLIVFFSKPYMNKLIAEVFFSENGTNCYRDLIRLNASVKFLFTFNDKSKIVSVITTTPQYE